MKKVIEKKSWIQEMEENYQQTTEQIIVDIKTGKLNKLKKIRVAGFEIEKNNEKETKETEKKFLREKNEMEEFRNKLKAKGINPVAVLPKKIFDKMISNFHFYTFKEFNEKGEVRGNMENLVQNNLSENFINRIMIISFFITLSLFAISTFYFQSIIPIVFWLITFIVFDISVRNNLDKLAIVSSFIVFPLASVLFSFVEKIQPKINTKKKLWPNKKDGGSDWIKIILPKAPKEVEDKLLKCHENNIKTYLVIHEKGFGIETDELVKKAKIKYDPIICNDSLCGKYVAIIDQFGDIPEEKKLIKKIKEQFMFITEELSLKYNNFN